MQVVQTHLRTRVLLLAALAALSGAATAGEASAPATPAMPADDGKAPPESRTETVLVTATRRETPQLDVPNVVEVRDWRELQERRAVRTVPEALREIPGVSVQKTSHGQGSPYIRGFTGFRTLFMVDGVRLNNSTFREGPNQYWNSVDPLTVERLELVKGPGSVLWGSDAVGGTVNAIGRSRQELPGGSQWERRVYYRYASAEDAHVTRAETGVALGGSTDFFAGVSVKDFGDVVAGREVGEQRKTGYSEWGADFRLEHRFTEHSALVLAHQSVGQDGAWRTHATRYGIGWEGTTVGTDKWRILDQDRGLTYLQFRAGSLDGPVEALRASLSWQTQEEVQDRRRADDRRDVQGVDVGTLGAWVQAETPSPIGRLTWGVDWYRDRVESYRRNYLADGSFAGEAIQGPVADNASYDLLGAFVQDEIDLTSRLKLYLGLRYTYAQADAGQVEDPATGDKVSLYDSWDALVGSARLVWSLDAAEQWRLFGGASQGFRAPNLSDLTRLDTARSGEIETPSPGLDPERFVCLELGFKGQAADWSLQVAYFYTLIDDMIVRMPTGDLIDGDIEVTKANSGEGYVHGVELGGSWRFRPQLTVFGGFSWAYGEVDTYPTSLAEKEREPLDKLMPAAAHLGLRWEAPDGRSWAECAVVAAGEADELSSADERDTQRIPPGGTPGYAVLNIRAGWELVPGLRLSAGIENLTNEDYRIHGSGQNEPGTNVILAVDWRF